jgi:UDP-N-acetyl-D-glucosamine dehydrogenase
VNLNKVINNRELGLMQVFVIGAGYVGLPLAVTAAISGFKVTAFDIDKGKILKLKQGLTQIPGISQNQLLMLQSSGQLRFTSELVKQKEKAIYVIAVPTPLTPEKLPDLKMLRTASESIAQIVSEGSLIINESTSYIGSLRGFIKPIIDNIANLTEINYAVAPERIDPGNTKWSIRNTPRIVSGITKSAIEEAKLFYRNFCDDIHVVSTPEVAEAAKLVENTFRLVNIALVNELSEIAHSLKFSIYEAISAAATKPYGFMPFYPSIGVGGHCIPIDPSYLKYSAKLAGVSANIIDLANQVNWTTPKNIAKRIKEVLGGQVKGKKIQLAGIAYKPNIADTRESPALELIRELQELGGIISWHDPLIGESDIPGGDDLQINLDLGLIVTPHDQIDFTKWKISNVKVLDLSVSSENFGWPKFF